MVNCSSGRITYVKPVKTNIVTQKWGIILYNNKRGGGGDDDVSKNKKIT